MAADPVGRGGAAVRQIALPLGWPEPPDLGFIVTPSNAQAAHLLDHWAAWPVRAAVLTGPPRSGRTLLARVFAAASGATVIDDAEAVEEAAIFHAWNAAQAERRPLLIVAGALPPAWPVALPDLRTRLAASAHAAIGPPDDALVRALLVDRFARRRLDARPALVDWLTARLPRSHGAVLAAVDRLDRAVMQTQRRLSITLAREVLSDPSLVEGTPS